MPIVKRYTFQPRVSAGLASQFNTNFDDIIDAFNNHRHSGVGTDAPNITISGIQNSTLVGLKNPYRFRVYRTAAFTLSAGSFAKVSFDNKDFDPSNNFDAVTNFRYTAPVTGYYQFNAGVGVLTSPGSFLIVSLYRNGAEIERGTQLNCSAAAASTMNALVSATAGDYFEIYVYGTNAVSADVGNAAARPRFSGFLVSGA